MPRAVTGGGAARRQKRLSCGGGGLIDALGERRTLGSEVVATDTDNSRRELVEAALPRGEAMAEDPQGITGAAERVTTALLGVVRVSLDGVEHTSGAGSGLPPAVQQSPGTPQGHSGYPGIV